MPALLMTAAIVGVPTGVAVRNATQRAAGAVDRPWWIDALWAGFMLVVALPFAVVIAVALGWVRLRLGM